METHWEEVIQCIQPEKRWEKGLKKADFSLDADDTESELIAIPESDLSDSTLHGSVQVIPLQIMRFKLRFANYCFSGFIRGRH